MNLKMPPSALRNVKEGDRVTLSLAADASRR